MHKSISGLKYIWSVFLLTVIPGITQAAYWNPVDELYIPSWDAWGEDPEVIYAGNMLNSPGVYHPVMYSVIRSHHRGGLLSAGSEGGNVVWDFSTILQLQGLGLGQQAKVSVSVYLSGELTALASPHGGIDDTNAWVGAAYDIAASTSGGDYNRMIEQSDLRAIGLNNEQNYKSFSIGGVVLDNIMMTNGDVISLGGLASAWANSSVDFNGGATAETEATFGYVVKATVIPIPPAFWLFGSGFIGLIGIARRKKS